MSCCRSAIDPAGYASAGAAASPPGAILSGAMDQLFDTGEPPRGRTAVPARARARSPARMRPRTLDEFVGQEHLLGAGQRAAHRDRAGPAALDGPLRAARARARRRSRGSSPTQRRRRVRGAQRRRGRPRRGPRGARARRASAGRATGEPTIFFLDEIHRFNKAQQDALLPAVEEGLVTLIGATTENPYFEVNSRAAVAHAGLRAARADARPTSRCCCGGRSSAASAAPHEVDDDAVAFLAARAGGDARTALAALELACETARRRRAGHARARRGRAAAPRAPLRQAAATTTTTRSRPGSRRRAARTRTPRSTTSR